MAFYDVVAWLHGRSRRTDLPVSVPPRPLITVLGDGESLRAAIERAVSFERDVAIRTASNIARHEEMVGSPVLVETPKTILSTESVEMILREPA